MNLCRARLPTSERAATKTEPQASCFIAVRHPVGQTHAWPAWCGSSASSGQVSSGPLWPQNNRTSWPKVVRPVGAISSSVFATLFCRLATKLAVSSRQAGNSAEMLVKGLPEKANSTCNLLVLARFLGGLVGSGWAGRTRHLTSICWAATQCGSQACMTSNIDQYIIVAVMDAFKNLDSLVANNKLNKQ